MKKRETDNFDDSRIIGDVEDVLADNKKMNFTLKLQDFLKANYKTSRELKLLGEQIGISSTTIKEWSYGRVPSLRHLNAFIQLSKIHNITLEELFCGAALKDESEILVSMPIYSNSEVKLILKILKTDKGQ